jgi:hypothetical protein
LCLFYLLVHLYLSSLRPSGVHMSMSLSMLAHWCAAVPLLFGILVCMCSSYL